MDWRVRAAVRFLWLGFLLAAIPDGSAEQKIVCYYTNWSVYRPGTAKFSPQNINPYLCTHLIYAFGGFTKDNVLKPFDKYQDIEKGGFAKFTGLKTYNKNLKTMLAIGGWNEGSGRFSPMVADATRRREFVKNAVKFLRQNHFDGLDLDWEYPAFRDGGKPRDRDNYANLVQELRDEFERESSKTGRPRLLLSMAVPAGIEYIDKGYDVPKLNKYLDFINLLSYDYHSAFEPAVNHHSPLYPLEEDNEYNYDTELTIDYTIKYLLEKGASSEKIILGIPTYGRSYTLFNEEATDIGAPADGPGEEGDATREKGYLAYYEICESIMKSDEWEVVSPNPNAMGPYAYRGNQWVGYDDEAIVRLKAQYVNEHGLGGIMFWSIDNDDFRGTCHDRPYPLIEAAKETMLSGDGKNGVRQKTKTQTKTRTQSLSSNSIGRKLGGRRRTTEEPPSGRQRDGSSKNRISSQGPKSRSNTQQSLDDEETQAQVNGRNRGQFIDPVEEGEATRINNNAVRSAETNEEDEDLRSRDRNRAQGGRGRRKKPGNKKLRSTTESAEEEYPSRKITTPAPPTTPDPGSDFKCEDEGFFSHPRDCKKYFWCLDSGPGGLGIVAHQFTCPAGLVFNKAADSCDYPRNVVCPNTKSSTKSVSTTRAPITAATSRTTRLQSPPRHRTTSTTPAPPESDEEYEYYDDEEEDEPVTTTTARSLLYKTINRSRSTTASTTTTAGTTTTTAPPRTTTTRSYQSLPPRGSSRPAITSLIEPEEDPQVIKDLIELIKKAGGIEELEKQLHIQERNSGSNVVVANSGDGDATPPTISRSLYERVLNRQSTRGVNSLFRGTTPTTPTTTEPEEIEEQASRTKVTSRTSNVRNGPGQAQFEGLDDIPEVKSLRRVKPQYTTINRQRTSTQPPEEDGDEDLDEDNENVASSEEKAISNPPEETPSSQRSTPNYVDIRRGRPTTPKPIVPDDEDEGYLNIRGRRPIAPKIEDEDDDEVEPSQDAQKTYEPDRRTRIQTQEDTPTTKSRYVTIQRSRSTTAAIQSQDPEESNSLDESTTEAVSQSTESTPTTVQSIESSPTPVPLSDTTEQVSPSQTSPTYEPSEEPISPTTTHISQLPPTTEPPARLPSDPPAPDISSTTTTQIPTTESVIEHVTEFFLTTTASIPTQESSSENPITNIYTTVAQPSSEELITRGFATVAQPRPFGFPRRRTTTLSSTPEPTSPVVPETGRPKVPSESVRLPTLKDQVGYQTILTHEHTTTPSSTPSVRNVPEDNHIILNEYGSHVDDIRSTNFIIDDIAQTTEILQEDESTTKYEFYDTNEASFTNVKYTNNIENRDYSTQPTLPMTLPIRIIKQGGKQANVRKVDVPVRILDSDDPLAEVVLQVPESKLHSLGKSAFKVQVINQNSSTTEKLNIINVGERKQIFNSTIEKGVVLPKEHVPSTEESLMRKENARNSAIYTKVHTTELIQNQNEMNFDTDENEIITTTPRVSTIRGRLFTTRPTKFIRGFYVTKDIETTQSKATTFPRLITQKITAVNSRDTQDSSTTPVYSEEFSTTDYLPTVTSNNSININAKFDSTSAGSNGKNNNVTNNNYSNTTPTLPELFSTTVDQPTITTERDIHLNTDSLPMMGRNEEESSDSKNTQGSNTTPILPEVPVSTDDPSILSTDGHTNQYTDFYLIKTEELKTTMQSHVMDSTETIITNGISAVEDTTIPEAIETTRFINRESTELEFIPDTTYPSETEFSTSVYTNPVGNESPATAMDAKYNTSNFFTVPYAIMPESQSTQSQEVTPPLTERNMSTSNYESTMNTVTEHVRMSAMEYSDTTTSFLDTSPASTLYTDETTQQTKLSTQGENNVSDYAHSTNDLFTTVTESSENSNKIEVDVDEQEVVMKVATEVPLTQESSEVVAQDAYTTFPVTTNSPFMPRVTLTPNTLAANNVGDMEYPTENSRLSDNEALTTDSPNSTDTVKYYLESSEKSTTLPSTQLTEEYIEKQLVEDHILNEVYKEFANDNNFTNFEANITEIPTGTLETVSSYSTYIPSDDFTNTFSTEITTENLIEDTTLGYPETLSPETSTLITTPSPSVIFEDIHLKVESREPYRFEHISRDENENAIEETAFGYPETISPEITSSVTTSSPSTILEKAHLKVESYEPYQSKQISEHENENIIKETTLRLPETLSPESSIPISTPSSWAILEEAHLIVESREQYQSKHISKDGNENTSTIEKTTLSHPTSLSPGTSISINTPSPSVILKETHLKVESREPYQSEHISRNRNENVIKTTLSHPATFSTETPMLVNTPSSSVVLEETDLKVESQESPKFKDIPRHRNGNSYTATTTSGRKSRPRPYNFDQHERSDSIGEFSESGGSDDIDKFNQSVRTGNTGEIKKIFVRRRIINRTTGEIKTESLARNSSSVKQPDHDKRYNLRKQPIPNSIESQKNTTHVRRRIINRTTGKIKTEGLVENSSSVNRPHEIKQDSLLTQSVRNSNSTKDTKRKTTYVRRRIINRTTGKIKAEGLVEDSPPVKRPDQDAQNSLLAQSVPYSNSFNKTLENTTHVPNRRLQNRRVVHRRRPSESRTSNKVETKISSQNSSASNDVQSSSVSSTNPNRRRRIVIKKYRTRDSTADAATVAMTTFSGALDDISQSDDIGGLNDNASSNSQQNVRVSGYPYGREELPRTESISEARLDNENRFKSKDEQADSEVSPFRNRARRPGTLVRPDRTNILRGNSDATPPITAAPSTRITNTVIRRRKLRPAERNASPVTAKAEVAHQVDESSKLYPAKDTSDTLDQSTQAQEFEVTVAVTDSPSPAPLTPSTSKGRPSFRTALRRRISTTQAPQAETPSTTAAIIRRRQRPQPFEKINDNLPSRPRHPAIIDYDYYADDEERVVGKPKLSGKLSISTKGVIQCLDQGNFAHPTSCKKFITCARMVNGQVIGTEYTCPDKLSFDPVGGICNWSAGLGCKE